MIRTASIYDDKSEKSTAIKVLVTRYWPRGVKKEARDYWFRDLGPSAGLIKDWKAGKLTWPEFKKAYLEEYKNEAKARLLDDLKRVIKDEGKGRDVLLLCTCREENHCHRGILKGLLEED